MCATSSSSTSGGKAAFLPLTLPMDFMFYIFVHLTQQMSLEQRLRDFIYAAKSLKTNLSTTN